jgi:hypothetical protein
MASVWVRTRQAKDGSKRFLVEYRAGGAEARVRHAGSFKKRRLATIRAALVESELPAGRYPDFAFAEAAAPAAPTLAEAGERWRASRVDVA